MRRRPTRYAAHKFIFLDSSKFRREGVKGYVIHELLETSQRVTLYTVSSTQEKDMYIQDVFERLCLNTLRVNAKTPLSNNKRTLELLFIDRDGRKARSRQLSGSFS